MLKELNNSNTNSTTKLRAKQEFRIYMQNVRCLKAHLAEINFHLQEVQPHIVMFQETWLDASAGSIDALIPGFKTVSRRDRATGANRGGIITLVCDDFKNLAHIFDSATEKDHGIS